MNTRTLNNKELQTEIKRDRTSTDYLEITGIKKNNIKNLPRDVQVGVESFIGSKTVTIWIRKQ
jgi:hypothetical protein|tara:strand:- start:548 stop:736 length:189 start_codon:yes stop_codon:yes gene_type:complete